MSPSPRLFRSLCKHVEDGFSVVSAEVDDGVARGLTASCQEEQTLHAIFPQDCMLSTNSSFQRPSSVWGLVPPSPELLRNSLWFGFVILPVVGDSSEIDALPLE